MKYTDIINQEYGEIMQNVLNLERMLQDFKSSWLLAMKSEMYDSFLKNEIMFKGYLNDIAMNIAALIEKEAKK